MTPGAEDDVLGRGHVIHRVNMHYIFKKIFFSNSEPGSHKASNILVYINMFHTYIVPCMKHIDVYILLAYMYIHIDRYHTYFHMKTQTPVIFSISSTGFVIFIGVYIKNMSHFLN